ncbi:hypothetical protein JI739_22120 [Ramlibacter sp. AW1]|uniref:Protease inhibitor Inh n=1 Tax=Ramlibacter aurantiacus TaxID=2801330 RepID=A0A937D5T7_9BURK|nr:hypothetical protein [Ramlibacter aurantiacus]MBL0423050.1 hypothetical protein [Ramlibacter aurantiacus]
MKMKMKSMLCVLLALPVAAWSQGPAEALQGRWSGMWSSKSTSASGDLELRFASTEGNPFSGQIRQTRPDNANWRCSEQLDPIEVRRSGESFTFDYSPGGRCAKASHAFRLQDGKLLGVYRLPTGAESEYVLTKQP